MADKDERYPYRERVKKALLEREKKPQDLKKETWQELDEKALTAIQLCLTDEVLDEFSMEKHRSRYVSDFRTTI